MEDKTPTPVGPMLPEVIEQLRLGQPERARRLLEALRGDDPVPCICGEHHDGRTHDDDADPDA